MKNQISLKLISLTFSILILIFVVGFYISAWTEPAVAPPSGNTYTPINVGTVSQIKQGPLQTNGFRNVGDTILDGSLTVGGEISASNYPPQNSCSGPNQSIKTINADGSVVCETDDVGSSGVGTLVCDDVAVPACSGSTGDSVCGAIGRKCVSNFVVESFIATGYYSYFGIPCSQGSPVCSSGGFARCCKVQ